LCGGTIRVREFGKGADKQAGSLDSLLRIRDHFWKSKGPVARFDGAEKGVTVRRTVCVFD
jgi:hypothetical protein